MSLHTSAAKASQDLRLDSRAGERNAHVRAARERLAYGHGNKPAFQYEQLLIFARNELDAALTIPLLAAIIGLASMFWAPIEEALCWLAVILVARVILVINCRKFTSIPPVDVDLPQWTKTLILTDLLYGVSWAGIVMVGLEPVDPTGHLFIFAALIVVLTIRLMFASTVMPILYAGTVPMTLALVARFVVLGDPFYWAMASMAVGLHVYFVFLAKGLNATVMAMLEFRAEKSSLVAELESAKSISDEARRRAEEANVAKSRFLATMSHELRTPLNAILGFSEVMQSELLGPLSNTTYKEYCANIHDSGRHLLHVINEILDLSRIEAGRHELHEEAVHLVEIARDCCRLLQLRLDSKNLNLVENFNKEAPEIWADARALRQVCLNLLSNALKFTPNGGHIEIRVEMNVDGGQRLVVKDNGPGIPQDELPKVMQAFGQGSLAHHSAEGGTGLGLPIVKGLIELHGGTLELTSKLRRGTEAIVTLPAQRVSMASEPLQSVSSEPLGLKSSDIDVKAQSARKRRSTSSQLPQRLAS